MTIDERRAELLAKHCTTKPKVVAWGDLEFDLAALPGWKGEGRSIEKAFTFKDHYETIAFVNAIAQISHRENHHPDLAVGYNKVVVVYTTHDAAEITENDFICAAKVNASASPTKAA